MATTMNLAREPISTDEYLVTAYHIFDCCGVESTSTLCVDDLMDKFVPLVKTNMAELSFLKTLLDPDQRNPEINVNKLAIALRQYSESPKTKMDLDESFNLKSGQIPQDSDSGISSDGLQQVEDLQCELKEKDRLNHHLRSQLDCADRQHEETTAAMTAERDSLRRHVNMLREENATLSHVRRDYDEACERLCTSGAALDDAKRELEALRRAARVSRDQVADLETDILCLQDLLAKSKDECHRINEMYATRQSALLEENETLKSQFAALTSRFQDQDEYMQQVIKEKTLLEIELKDTFSRSNQTQFRLDRSIDVSYTDDQMLTALDSLNADSRFSTENRILDEDSFTSALKDDPGRPTNMSLFDEIRMSFNVSRLNLTEFNTTHFDKYSTDNSLVTTATQTEEVTPCDGDHKNQNSLDIDTITSVTQTNDSKIGPYVDVSKDENCLKATTATQTDTSEFKLRDNKEFKVMRAVQTEESEFTPCLDVSKDDSGFKVMTATQTDESEFTPYVDVSKDKSGVKATTATQTDDIEFTSYANVSKDENTLKVTTAVQTNEIEKTLAETQTDELEPYFDVNKDVKATKDFEQQTDFAIDVTKSDMEIQTDGSDENELYNVENNIQNHKSSDNVNRILFEDTFEDTNERNSQYSDYVNVTLKVDIEIQTEASMLNGFNVPENNVQFLDAKDFTSTASQTENKRAKFIKKFLKLKDKHRAQADKMEPYSNNNNAHCTKCFECKKIENTNTLEQDAQYSSILVKEMEAKITEYENNLTCLEALIGQEKDRNEQQLALVDDLRSKIEILESACETQRDVINKITSIEYCCVQSQTEFDVISISTQTELPCSECEKRKVVPHRSLRRFFWEPLKCLFQVFAVLCFLGAISLLYGVSQRGRVRCDRERGVTPWRWFDAQDIMDLLLRIEYTSEVPM